MIYVLFPILQQICLLKSRNIIHEICRNSHFRALKIQNSTILLYHISCPTFEMAMPCLQNTLLCKSHAKQVYKTDALAKMSS